MSCCRSDLKAVVGYLYPLRKRRSHIGMESEMVAHVDQIGLSWSYCINNVDSLLEVHVCGVWIDAQCVYHQRFRAFDGVECGRR